MIRTRPRGGFSLIELLVVIAIIGVLTALLLAAVQRVRQASDRTGCANNLRQMGVALHHYHDASGGLPPGVSYHRGTDPLPFLSWSARLLPFLEQEALWKQTLRAFEDDPFFLDNPPHEGLATVMPVYHCPADPRTRQIAYIGFKVAFTDYLGVEGTDQFRRDGVLYLDSKTHFADITDGISNTLFVGERPPSADGALGWWYAGEGQSKDGSGDMVLGVQERNVAGYGKGCPVGPFDFGPGRPDNQCDAFHFWSLHLGDGAHFLFGDGSVRFVRYSAAPLLPALATRSNGEPAVLPD